MRKVFRAGDYATADEVSRGTYLNCGTMESKTRQSFAEDADINTLVRRFGVVGLAQRHPVAPATIAIFDDVWNFQTAMNAVVEAERLFMSLDSKLRLRFGNDPNEFVMFCSDPKNNDEMVRMGLAIPRKVEDTTPAVKPTGDGKNVGDTKEGSGSGGKSSKGSAGSAE